MSTQTPDIREVTATQALELLRAKVRYNYKIKVVAAEFGVAPVICRLSYLAKHQSPQRYSKA